MSPQKGNFLPIIGVIILLILVASGSYYLGFQSNKTEQYHPKNTPLPEIQYENPISSSAPKDQPRSPEWVNLVSFKTPSGWKESYSQYEGWPTITSPDFVAETEGMLTGKPKSGLLIHFMRTSNDEQRTIEEEEIEFKNTAGVQEVSRSTLGSFPAVHTRINYEGSKEMYIVIKDGYKWFISIETPNTLDGIRDAYDNNGVELKQLIDSIKFVDQ